MKVVLFCGGLGLRLRDYSEKVPKPMVPIGPYPILWHVMRYYAHHGHHEFILCLGYKAEVIKRYFVDFHEYLTNDFVLAGSGQTPELFTQDMRDWRITFVDTGLATNIGQRLKKVQPYLAGDDYFLANYSDTLTDAPLNTHLMCLKQGDKVGSFMCVKPPLSLHTVYLAGNLVKDIRSIAADILVNGGYFVFRRDIFECIKPGEELVEQPFQRLIASQSLIGQRYDGFWATMDTFKERQHLESLWANDQAPWKVWGQP